MKLRKTTIHNFRCYGNPTSIEFDDLTGLIGKNDAGKSAILDALNIFFGNAKMDVHDRCKHGGEEDDIIISCEFVDPPVEIDIDAGNQTTLAAEFLLTAAGHLCIKKVYKGKTPTLKGIFAVANHPTNQAAAGLLGLKRQQLRDRAAEVGADLTNVNSNKNAELRTAIRNAAPNLGLQEVDVALDKEDAKTIGEKLDFWMPAYALFKSDRDSNDGDDEAQDPINSAVAAAIKSKTAELDLIYEHVVSEVQHLADATLAKLRQMDPALAATLKPSFEKPTWHKLFKASIYGDAGIPVNKRGSGVRRLILLNFFRAKAQQLVAQRNAISVIYAIEEPETSQHPSNQRLLIRAFYELLQTEQCQVLVTTHTPVLARVIETDQLRYVRSAGHQCPVIEPVNDANTADIAKSLGVLPDSNVSLFLFVEGKHDIPFLLNLSDALFADGANVPNLRRLESEGRIIFCPLGGANLLLWASRMAQLGKPEFHLYDRDVPPPAAPHYDQAVQEVLARANNGEPVFAASTGKKEMENYLSFDAIKHALATRGIVLPRQANYGEWDDVPVLLTQEINAVVPQGRFWKQASAKTFLANEASQRMTQARLAAVDPNGDVMSWFSRINLMLQ